MRFFLLLILFFFIFSCKENSEQKDLDKEISDSNKSVDLNLQKELESIEETRTAFQNAIKENRFGDLKNYATNDVKSLTPDCGTWEPF